MSQRNDMAEKKRVLIDGVEIPGLVYVSEITHEKGGLDVPEFKNIRHIQNGVSSTPRLTLRYKITKDLATLEFFKAWYFDDVVHDVTIIRTDATGAEFARDLCQECECIKFSIPDYDAGSPKYAQISVDILPYEVIPMGAQ